MNESKRDDYCQTNLSIPSNNMAYKFSHTHYKSKSQYQIEDALNLQDKLIQHFNNIIIKKELINKESFEKINSQFQSINSKMLHF